MEYSFRDDPAVHLHGADRVQRPDWAATCLRGDDHRASAASRAGSAWPRWGPTPSLPPSPGRPSPRPRSSTKVSVPQMLGQDYNPRFAVGVVAGSSGPGHDHPALGHADHLFLRRRAIGGRDVSGRRRPRHPAGRRLCRIAIWLMGAPRRPVSWAAAPSSDNRTDALAREVASKTLPTLGLITRRPGRDLHRLADRGRGRVRRARWWRTPIAIGPPVDDLARAFWHALLETGHITAFAMLFLITAASIYSAGCWGWPELPNQLQRPAGGQRRAAFWTIMALYVLLMLFLGTLLDTASIILIVVPLFLPLAEAMGLSAWSGSGSSPWWAPRSDLLTPPLGISCFVIKSTHGRCSRISAEGCVPGGAAVRIRGHADLVLIVLIRFPIAQPGPFELIRRVADAQRHQGQHHRGLPGLHVGEDTEPRANARGAWGRWSTTPARLCPARRGLTHAEWRQGHRSYLEWLRGEISDKRRPA